MICSTHNVELGEGVSKKVCGQCIFESTQGIEKALKGIQEKQKEHWDSPLCQCDNCKVISK